MDGIKLVRKFETAPADRSQGLQLTWGVIGPKGAVTLNVMTPWRSPAETEGPVVPVVGFHSPVQLGAGSAFVGHCDWIGGECWHESGPHPQGYRAFALLATLPASLVGRFPLSGLFDELEEHYTANFADVRLPDPGHARKVAWQVLAGHAPSMLVKELGREWVLTAEELNSPYGPLLWTCYQESASAYAAELADPRRYNYVRSEFISY